MLVISIFSFSHDVLKRFLKAEGLFKLRLCGRGLPFPKQALVFTCLQYKPFENTVGKGEIAHNEQFLLFPQCFLSIWKTFCHFNQLSNCGLQTLSIWKTLKFVVWERVKGLGSLFKNYQK